MDIHTRWSETERIANDFTALLNQTDDVLAGDGVTAVMALATVAARILAQHLDPAARRTALESFIEMVTLQVGRAPIFSIRGPDTGSKTGHLLTAPTRHPSPYSEAGPLGGRRFDLSSFTRSSGQSGRKRNVEIADPSTHNRGLVLAGGPAQTPVPRSTD